MVYFLCKAYDSGRQNCYFALSLPVRGAWVEIGDALAGRLRHSGRSPCGERGLKCAVQKLNVLGKYVAPRAGSVG